MLQTEKLRAGILRNKKPINVLMNETYEFRKHEILSETLAPKNMRKERPAFLYEEVGEAYSCLC